MAQCRFEDYSDIRCQESGKVIYAQLSPDLGVLKELRGLFSIAHVDSTSRFDYPRLEPDFRSL